MQSEISIIETEDSLILKYSFLKNIMLIMLGLALLVYVFFSIDFDKFKSFFHLKFSPWMFVSVEIILLLLLMVFILIFIPIKNLKNKYYCKFDKINHSFYRLNKFICSFNEIDFILIEQPLLTNLEKVVVQKKYYRLFLSLKNNKKEVVSVDIDQEQIFQLAKSISLITGLEIKEDYYKLSL